MMENNINFATWNLCLGLSNKRDIVTQYLHENDIKVCCLQETEIPIGFPETILNCGNYNLELELNNTKKRAGIYLHETVSYIRRIDLEKEDHHIVIVDVKLKFTVRVISLYRSFRPGGGMSPEMLFRSQLDVMRGAMTNNCLIMGDFNLDACMELRDDYNYKIHYGLLSEFTTRHNLLQLVNFKTWSRIVNGIKKESTLDHIYTNKGTKSPKWPKWYGKKIIFSYLR